MNASTGGVGNGWVLSDQPYMVHYDGTNIYTVVFSPLESYRFTESAGVFTGANNIQETLTAADDGTLTFTQTDGTVLQFGGFGFGANNALNGQLLGFYAADGSSEVVTATDGPDNQISQMQWFMGGSSQPYQQEDLTYVGGSGVNAARVSAIVLSAWDPGTSALVPVRRADYTYYDGSVPSFGWIGDLQSATESVYNAAGTSYAAVGSDYYRYTGGHLTLALSPQGVANADGLSTVETAETSTLAPMPRRPSSTTAYAKYRPRPRPPSADCARMVTHAARTSRSVLGARR